MYHQWRLPVRHTKCFLHTLWSHQSAPLGNQAGTAMWGEHCLGWTHDSIDNIPTQRVRVPNDWGVNRPLQHLPGSCCCTIIFQINHHHPSTDKSHHQPVSMTTALWHLLQLSWSLSSQSKDTSMPPSQTYWTHVNMPTGSTTLQMMPLHVPSMCTICMDAVFWLQLCLQPNHSPDPGK